MGEQYTYEEVQDKLGISKATLYNRINKFENILDKHIKVLEKKKHIDSVGLEVIKRNSLEYLENLEEDNTKVQTSLDKNRLEVLEKEIDGLKKQLQEREKRLQDKDKYLENLEKGNNILEKQLENKDIQIKNIDERLKEANEINKNSQILLREEQQKILMIENKDQKEKGFWRRLLKN